MYRIYSRNPFFRKLIIPQCLNEEEVEAEIWESEDENEVEDDVIDDTVALKFVKLMCIFCYRGKVIFESLILQ